MEHLGYGNLFVDRIFIPGEPDIFQRMCQVFHKCRFCFRGKRLDSKCSRTDMLFRNFGFPVHFHILHQLVQIIILISLMKALQFFPVRKKDQLVLRPRRCNIDQFLIIFEPVISSISSPSLNAVENSTTSFSSP